MLPPIIPLSAAPVTTQHDPVRQQPSIAPVVPAQPSATDSNIDFKKRDPQESGVLLRDEQRRRQGKRRKAPDEELYQALPGDEVNADNTVPVAPLMGEQPRQGLLVDIEV